MICKHKHAFQLFNQITLICDWFYNVECKESQQFQDYTNGRLYEEGAKLLDDQEVIDQTGAVTKPVAAPAAPKGGAGKTKVKETIATRKAATEASTHTTAEISVASIETNNEASDQS